MRILNKLLILRQIKFSCIKIKIPYIRMELSDTMLTNPTIPNPTFFTARQAVKLTGVRYGTLNYWAKVRFVEPSVLPAQGSGSRRLYDFDDLVAIRVAVKLRKAGVFGNSIARILGIMRQIGFDSPAAIKIEVTGSREATIALDGDPSSRPQTAGGLFVKLTCDCREEFAELRRILRPFGSDSCEV